jgi:quinol monooxygenase YgiN
MFFGFNQGEVTAGQCVREEEMNRQNEMSRRRFVATTTAAISALGLGRFALAEQEKPMYGQIVMIKVAPGKRDELINILLQGSSQMPGCLSYVIAKDLNEEDSLWITEAWVDKVSHQSALSLPSVQQSIAKARPLIAHFGAPVITVPVGGLGLVASN